MEEKSFGVVLVDIHKAANDNEIHCVERPLTDGDLKYVAISYRWGELAESVLDTNLGYVANVRSFDLNDFYTLCKTMTQERDLQEMDYVWVDAICVDQTDDERKKATIYRMTDIYEKASFILAVPDLHLRYLKDVNIKNKEIIDCSAQLGFYIYHLIHENIDRLVALDEQWLDSIGVPKNRALRQMLSKYASSHFVDGLTKYKVNDVDYNPNDALEHIQKAVLGTHAPHRRSDFVSIDDSVKSSAYGLDRTKSHQATTTKSQDNKNEPVHHDWPYHVIKQVTNDKWKQLISQRNNSIILSMGFLEDLVKDWSSRVWVINEYSIANRKNKLKYWFIQLQQHQHHQAAAADDFSFFKFDSNDLLSSRTQHNIIFGTRSSYHQLTIKSNLIFEQFRKTMLRQLNQQSFLEMILKSKATRNDDRFHAILPLSKYKNKVHYSKDVVDQWNIRSVVGVKLKLFELMDTKDKLDLLFLSCMSSNKSMVMPTFASTLIDWPAPGKYATMDDDGSGGGEIYPCNFDLTNDATIMLFPSTTTSSDCKKSITTLTSFNKLNLKPLEYYTCNNPIFAQTAFEKNRTQCQRLGLDDPNDQLDMVCIPSYGDSDIKALRHNSDFEIRQMFLIGSLMKNKWMVIIASSIFTLIDTDPTWTLHYVNSSNIGFDIY